MSYRPPTATDALRVSNNAHELQRNVRTTSELRAAHVNRELAAFRKRLADLHQAKVCAECSRLNGGDRRTCHHCGAMHWRAYE